MYVFIVQTRAVMRIVLWRQYVLNSPLLRYELYYCTRDDERVLEGQSPLSGLFCLTRSEAPNEKRERLQPGKHVMVYFPDGGIAKLP